MFTINRKEFPESIFDWIRDLGIKYIPLVDVGIGAETKFNSPNPALTEGLA